MTRCSICQVIMCKLYCSDECDVEQDSMANQATAGHLGHETLAGSTEA